MSGQGQGPNIFYQKKKKLHILICRDPANFAKKKKIIIMLFLMFLVKHDSSDVYLKNGLIQNRFSQRRFFA